jgi:hypothetical protein
MGNTRPSSAPFRAGDLLGLLTRALPFAEESWRLWRENETCSEAIGASTAEHLNSEDRRWRPLAHPPVETARMRRGRQPVSSSSSTVRTITSALPALGSRAAASEGIVKALDPFKSVVNSTAFIFERYRSIPPGSMRSCVRSPTGEHLAPHAERKSRAAAAGESATPKRQRTASPATVVNARRGGCRLQRRVSF